jgi:predicted DCC family thiol-disulfide oxidoreductase YuxK
LLPNTADIKNKAIVLFDGSCGLCNRSVKFILRHEKKNELYFSPLQSEFGKAILEKFNLVGKTDSVVFIKNGKAYIKSAAALRFTAYLKGLWPLLFGLIIVPPFIRNWVYDYIASNRITWFGTADYCDMLTPELKKRFLE